MMARIRLRSGKRRGNRGVFAILLLLAPGVVHAHVEQAEAGFMSGLMHPVFGLDHFLAMLSVGIVSAQLGGRHIWAVPSAFVTAMIVGASAGLLGYGVPLLENGIALSVVLLGIAIALVRNGRLLAPIYAFVAFFGFLHGYAHGLEMPRAADPVYYAGGFLVSTVSIHLLGVGIGHVMTSKERFRPLLSHFGSMMAGMGLMILIHLL